MILAIPIITPDRKTWDVQYIEKEKQDFEEGYFSAVRRNAFYDLK